MGQRLAYGATEATVTSQLTRESGAPRGREVAQAARRLGVVRWFTLPPRPEVRAPRLLRALDAYASAPPDPRPVEEVRLLDGPAGRHLLGSGRTDPERHTWQGRVDAQWLRAREALLASGRGRGHPLLAFMGRSVSIRREILPVRAAELVRRLRATPGPVLPGEVAGILAERVVLEMGAYLVWEMVADLLGPNPFEALLTIYEEGCYPVELPGPRAVVWAPASDVTPRRAPPP